MISKLGGAWYTGIPGSNINILRSSFSACAHVCETLNDFWGNLSVEGYLLYK